MDYTAPELVTETLTPALIASRIDAAREAAGLSVRSLAATSGIPYSSLYFSLYKGRDLGLDNLFRLRTALGLDLSGYVFAEPVGSTS